MDAASGNEITVQSDIETHTIERDGQPMVWKQLADGDFKGFFVSDTDDDRYLPRQYVGHPIAPNYFCRGWNGKRKKYCGARAGQATSHVGSGRCSMHRGNAKTTHGLRSRYKVGSESMRARFARFESDPALLDMRNEVVVLCSLLDDALDNDTFDRDVCTRLASEVSKAKERLHSNAAKQAFSVEQAKRWFFGVDRIIDVRVPDVELANQIKLDIMALGVL